MAIQRTHLVRTAEPYSCIAVIFNSAMWLIYGIPTIRELVNLPMMFANGIGILVELYYVYVFIQHAVGRRRKPVLILLAAAVVIFTVLGVFLGMTVCRHKWPRTFVGDLAAISGVVMYLVPVINTVRLFYFEKQINTYTD